jgi:hypothetical protein
MLEEPGLILILMNSMDITGASSNGLTAMHNALPLIRRLLFKESFGSGRI